MSSWHGRKWIRDEKRLAIYIRDGLACAYCGATIEDGAQFSLDHLRPRSRWPVDEGGKPRPGINDPNNLATCCTRCNSRRQNRPLTTWIEKVAGYCNVEAIEIKRHVARCRVRKIDVAEAKKIMARRGGLVPALAGENAR